MLNNHLPYEGGGFLLTYKGNVILGNRIKKPEDLAKDPIKEVEYFGGKPEPEDNNDPLTTAFNELIEEVGRPILDINWRNRIVPIHIFQPFSNKWIWCSMLEVTDDEFQQLIEADQALDSWSIDEKRDLSKLTGRQASVRKAISKLVIVPVTELCDYITHFSNDVSKSKNRLADAKTYRERATLNVSRISNCNDKMQFPLRAFNTVIFENHVETIKKGS
jgi:hypothetical protein